MKKTSSLLSLLIAAVVLLAACSRLTQSNLDKIKTGMTKEEVQHILGKPTRADSATVLGMSGTEFYYKAGNTEITVTFVNDAVVAKNGVMK
jgi:outer membrane protein assembly factor BamE (lipoprotein component of BamABCDE complex)